MPNRVNLPVFCLAALLLSACDKGRSDPPAPLVEPVRVGASTTQPPLGGTSVPTAASVVAAESVAAKPAATADRSNTQMTRAEESSAMPMAGQNNDHSAPLTAAKRASAP